MSLRRWCLLGPVLCVLAACVPEFADDQSVIVAPRILAVRAVPAEAKIGMTVQLTALVAAPPPGAARADDLAWALCLARKPLTELGPVAHECIDQVGAGPETFQHLGRGASVSSTIPSDACRRFGPLSAPAEAGGVAGRPVDPDLSGGYHQPVVVGSGVGVALGTIRLGCGIVGVPNAESVRFNQGYRPNENPEVERLEIVGPGGPREIVPGVERPGISLPVGARVDLRVVWPACPRQAVCGDGLCTSGENQSNCAADCRTNPKSCAGAESYLWANSDTRVVSERREGISVAWYGSAGTFVDEQTGRTESDPDGVDSFDTWTAPDSPGLVKLWIVLRDDRGGVGWKEYMVEVTR